MSFTATVAIASLFPNMPISFHPTLAVALLAAMSSLLLFQVAQIVVQAVEALVPEAAVVLHPVSDLPERTRLERAGAPLRITAARDQSRALEHLEVLGDGGHAHLEGLGQLGDRGLAGCKASQDRAPGGIGEGCEGGAEVVCRHIALN